ncbi:MAG: nicotinate-nucleotide--dimethylbenzimidazole phosphoribosyltransferase [Betaproteobacteria bacterium HGW-Betaproteobacteria-3]|jgi:nicotinate-nucleotide--dimethylbenzimidazole phosphoribosyltransferase|nr:MAG: nicotinate-nucleotide--dimethylbenzimidazole phosphoribosyltransferase [Betaproteobacteria bacterium HGW-Betaproteobacteria-3]
MSESPSVLLLPGIEPTAHPALEAALRLKMDHKAKPLGALGRLEALAVKLGLIQRSETITLEHPQLLVFAADHGIADEGVSAYPQSMTLQMVLTLLAGGATVNVLARQHGFATTVVDAGVASAVPDHDEHAPGFPLLVRRKIGFGTRNMLLRAAMSQEQATAALHAGMDAVQYLPGNVVAFGDMGVGNTSSAALLLSRLGGVPLRDAMGLSVAIDDAPLQRKHEILGRVAARHRGALLPLDALAAMGGFEIAMMAGAMLRAASQQRVILVDGFVAGAAALVARRLCAAVTDYMVFCNCADDDGHRLLLSHLQVKPLLDLDLRLGEGAGALLAWPLVQSAGLLLNEMATRPEPAAVSGATPATPDAMTGR